MDLRFGKFPPPIPGFRYSGQRAGLKKDPNAKDIALIVSDRPKTAVAALFTKNAFAAPPVLLGRKLFKSARGMGRAVIANSGNANAATGRQGLKDAEAMQNQVARTLGLSRGEVYVSSTGKIGIPLPMEKVHAGIARAIGALSEDGFVDAATAICTTDKAPKFGYGQGKIGNTPYTLALMGKGAGMIAPHMATMLCYVLTDLAVAPRFWQRALKIAAHSTVNAMSVDGDTSTNDTVLAFANGAALNAPIVGGRAGDALVRHLTDLMAEFARSVVSDGEGATKCLEIAVSGAKSAAQAQHIARAIGNSSLVKCAFYGNDPNWGRIASAAGAADPSLRPEKISLSIANTPVFRTGQPLPFSEPALNATLKKSASVSIALSLGLGKASARYFASDLTPEYVHFNSAYST